VCKTLSKDAALVWSFGSAYAGKLVFPYGYGVIFTNITRRAFEETDLGEVFEPHLVICRDEMTQSQDAEAFQSRLWNLSAYQFGKTLMKEQIDRVRWHIFPELRISTEQLSLFSEESSIEQDVGEEESQRPIAISQDLIRIMDLQQEQLARSLGDGHRLIHGVSGSGKTLILTYRCQYLAAEQSKPILVLCFNVALASRLRQMLQDENMSASVTVCNFHSWCRDLFGTYKLVMPNRSKYDDDTYFEELVNLVIQAVDKGRIPKGQYGAVMIDEGHDFRPEWLKLVVQMVDPQTNSLLVLYDDAQKLYGKNGLRRFSFSSVDIQARGRTTILKINYRNTAEVLALAYEFAKEGMTPTEDREEDTPVLVQPQSAGRHGPRPELVRLPSFRHETEYLTQRVQQLHEHGIPWNDMAIAYRLRFVGERVYDQLRQAQVPVEWVSENSASRSYQPDAKSIKLMTMHSSKGLEFPVVFIPGVGYLPSYYGDPTEEARLLYVAMTRAINQLVLTCDRDSSFVTRIQRALERVVEIAP
jgi:superfamily I DNA/RNA helicase